MTARLANGSPRTLEKKDEKRLISGFGGGRLSRKKKKKKMRNEGDGEREMRSKREGGEGVRASACEKTMNPLIRTNAYSKLKTD